MRFYEYETWKLKEGVNIEEYDQMLRDWFQFLHDHKEELFQEWISAKYYKETDIEGVPSGRYIMVFEYESWTGIMHTRSAGIIKVRMLLISWWIHTITILITMRQHVHTGSRLSRSAGLIQIRNKGQVLY